MPVPLRPGVPTAMFAKLDDQFQIRGRIAITEVADAVKYKTKERLKVIGSHRLGTPTPAYRGGPPAMISKTLYNSIDRSIVSRMIYGYLCQVGTAAGRFPQYSRRKASSKYGYILEVTWGEYPFLYDAAKWVFDVAAPQIYKQKYGDNWVRLI